VVVVDVAKASPGAEKGVRPGDVILEAAQEEDKSATQVATKASDAKQAGHNAVVLLVDGHGERRFVPSRLAEDGARATRQRPPPRGARAASAAKQAGNKSRGLGGARGGDLRFVARRPDKRGGAPTRRASPPADSPARTAAR